MLASHWLVSAVLSPCGHLLPEGEGRILEDSLNMPMQ